MCPIAPSKIDLTAMIEWQKNNTATPIDTAYVMIEK